MELVDKINVINDRRIRRCSATIEEKTYGYLLAEPEGGFKRTVFLIHGFPDLSMAWRNQIPLFLSLGFRVVCPDCIGYGRSDAPTNSIIPYTYKSHADDFVQLAKQLECENIVLGGHDWGAVIAYRFALYHPTFITHLFTLCVPYIPPAPQWIETEALAKIFPSLGYQLQFAGGDVEAFTQDKEGIRLYLNALYGGTTPEGQHATNATKGVDFDLAPKLGRSLVISEEELAYYVDEYARNGFRGPCNYYRNGHQNFLDEQQVFITAHEKDAILIKCPTLFIRAMDDSVITPEMVKDMGSFVPDLSLEEVNAGHWILWQKPAEVNATLKKWIQKQGLVQ